MVKVGLDMAMARKRQAVAILAIAVAVGVMWRVLWDVIQDPVMPAHSSPGSPSRLSAPDDPGLQRTDSTPRLTVTIVGIVMCPMQLVVSERSEVHGTEDVRVIARRNISVGDGVSHEFALSANTPTRIEISQPSGEGDEGPGSILVQAMTVDVPPLALGEARQARLDLNSLVRCSITLRGRAATAMRVSGRYRSVDESWPPMDILVSPSGATFDLYVRASGIATFEMLGVGHYGTIALVSAGRTRELYIDAPCQVDLQLARDDLGYLRLERPPDRSAIAFAYRSLGAMSDVLIEHPPISLKELLDADLTHLEFLTGDGSWFRVPITQLHVDSEGWIRVLLPGDKQNAIVVEVAHVTPAGWSVWARGSSDEAMPLLQNGQTWRISGLADGAYRIHWRGPPLRRVPIGEVSLPTPDGENSVVIRAETPRFEDVRVEITNWVDLPVGVAPGTLYLEGNPNLKPPVAGTFMFQLSRPLELYRQAVFNARGVVGGIAGDVRITDTGLAVTLRLTQLRTVRLVPRLGGTFRVQCVDEALKASGVGAGAFRTASMQSETAILAGGGQATIRLWERSVDGALEVYRGTFALQSEASVVDPGGKFVPVEVQTQGGVTIILIEGVGGHRYETLIATLAIGGSRIWIPDSANEIVVGSSQGVLKVPASIETLVVSPR